MGIIRLLSVPCKAWLMAGMLALVLPHAVLAGCGDCTIDGIEECDDCNAVDGDACTNACTDAECGDGIVQVGVEACDDGNDIDEDACDSFCELTCGNDQLDGLEECDDGNTINTDDCTNACLDAECGDGIVEDGVEECDDGNDIDEDGCDTFCELTCGNGIEDEGEDCDDGNTVDGDACPSNCLLPCPLSLCSCLGAANRFTAVGGKAMSAKTGKYSDEGFPEYVETIVSGSLCAPVGKFVAREAASDVDGDVILTRAAGSVAAGFGGFTFDGVFEPGTYISGDLVTGGGAVNGPNAVVVYGDTLLDPNDARVANCRTAVTDLKAASTTLKNLPPSQSMDAIVVKDGNTFTLNLGPGIQVVNVNKIQVVSGVSDGAPLPSTLMIQCALDTQVAVINVANELKVGAESVITSTCGEDAVILNVHGNRPKVSLRFGAQVSPVLLSPGKDVKLPILSSMGNVYSGGKVAMSGAEVNDVLLCAE